LSPFSCLGTDPYCFAQSLPAAHTLQPLWIFASYRVHIISLLHSLFVFLLTYMRYL